MIRFLLCSSVCLILLWNGEKHGVISSFSPGSLPRGVNPQLATFYSNEKTFQCLDGSATIPFELVNDDYCDCEDGSDEPGTSACHNGQFYCQNRGHTPTIIASSRVNDGICDCCDGSDEWSWESSVSQCENKCDELGEIARREAEALAAKIKEGLNVKQTLIREGRELRGQRQAELDKLQKDLELAHELQLEKEEKKLAAEELEKEVLDKFNAIQDQLRQEREEIEKQEDEKKCLDTFAALDADNDKILRKNEMLASQIFDQNKDGSVTEEEVEFFLSGVEEVPEDEFKISLWPLLKPHLAAEESSGQGSPSEENLTPGDEVEEDYPYNENLEQELPDVDDVDDLDGIEPPPAHKEENLPEYDDETKALVDAANQAREAYESVRQEVKNIESKIDELKNSLSKDFGREDEYAGLENKCFEYHDHEYVYKVCLFDYCSQKPNSGGSETRLGNWDRWEDDYSVMIFSNGQQCWNGPKRSTKITLKCASETKLLSVTEPNKCEYHMTLEIPSACKPLAQGHFGHDEL